MQNSLMRIRSIIESSIAAKQQLLSDSEQLSHIQTAAEVCIRSIRNGGKILLCGNGGSAADAQHIAAELSGRFKYDRPPIYAEALHVNTSFLTAVGNDYGFDHVYTRMVEAAGKPADVLIGLSTSGNSANVVNALKKAQKLHITTIGIAGKTSGQMMAFCDTAIQVPSDDTARIQEMHILVGHILCELIESEIFPKKG
jgi:D-sedoheptulose 7-phosphate isomerase